MVGGNWKAVVGLLGVMVLSSIVPAVVVVSPVVLNTWPPLELVHGVAPWR